MFLVELPRWLRPDERKLSGLFAFPNEDLGDFEEEEDGTTEEEEEEER